MIFNIKHNKEDKRFYNNWFEFYPKISNLSFTYQHGNYNDERPLIHICLGWGNLYFNLPFKTNNVNNIGCENPRYGFYWFEGQPWFCLGKDYKTFRMPWNFEWYKTQTLLNDGTWFEESVNNRKDFLSSFNFLKENAWNELIPFTYIFPENDHRKEEKQHRVARVTFKRMEFRRYGLMNFKIFNKIYNSLYFDFNDEVGIKSGSWKGGTLGSSVDVLPNETYEEAFRRAVETIISKY